MQIQALSHESLLSPRDWASPMMQRSHLRMLGLLHLRAHTACPFSACSCGIVTQSIAADVASGTMPILLQLVSPACRMMVESIPSSDTLVHNAPLFMFRLFPFWNRDCVLVCSFFVHCPSLYPFRTMGECDTFGISIGGVNLNGISNSSRSLFLSSSSGASRPLPRQQNGGV
jgi:hypothetical protein